MSFFQLTNNYKNGIIINKLFQSDVPFTNAKVMVWDDMGVLTPVAQAEDIKIN